VIDVAIRPLNLISLCSGVGMLDEGLRAGLESLGIESRVVLHVEREIAAVAQLATLMEAGCLDAAPVWDDLTTLDCRPWRWLVDGVVAGFPCQPHSVAGQQKGVEDDRWIWPDIARIIRETESSFAFLENVPGLFHGAGIEHVLADLAAIGFDAEWCHLEASAVGAAHKRQRVFVLAYRKGFRWGQWWAESDGQQGRSDAAEFCGPLENAAWHERHGSLGKSGCGRRVREAGSHVDDAGCAERRPHIIGRSHLVEGQDAERQTTSRIGESDEIVAVAADIGRERPTRTGRQEGAWIEHGGEALAISDGTRSQGGGTMTTRKDGKTRMDMLDWKAESFSRQVRSTLDGRELSPTHRTLPQRLNPAFSCWLMGWPIWWTNPALTSSAKSEMESWRSKLRSRLSDLLGG
jgi:site-specific DNA-cytosine methylase